MNKKRSEERRTVVRGCEKRIYHVKNTESDIFDEAYLVLRRQEKGRCATPGELEREAMRIVNGISESGESKESPKRGKEWLKAFLSGVIVSALTIGVISLILWLAL